MQNFQDKVLMVAGLKNQRNNFKIFYNNYYWNNVDCTRKIVTVIILGI